MNDIHKIERALRRRGFKMSTMQEPNPSEACDGSINFEHGVSIQVGDTYLGVARKRDEVQPDGSVHPVFDCWPYRTAPTMKRLIDAIEADLHEAQAEALGWRSNS